MKSAEFILKSGQVSAKMLNEQQIMEVEVFAKGELRLCSNQCDKTQTCAKDESMEELNVNLKQSANYLIQLFFKTNRKYSCTRTKIGKLLSIIAFKYAMEKKKIFVETIYKYGDCGTAINEIMNYLDKDVYLSYIDQDDKSYISDEINDSLEDTNYSDYRSLDVQVKRRIEEVFRLFGAYSSSQLAKCINSIINQDDIINENEEINIEKISELTRENIRLYDNEDLSLINYLFSKTKEI